jgi:hypothetical protein
MKIPSLVQQLTRAPIARPCPEPWDGMAGDFVVSVRDKNGKLRDAKFHINADKLTVVDLD